MNILTKYTGASLRKNKTRTIVTIIGIILSVSMFTAVTEALVSAQQFMIGYISETLGSYHAYASDLDIQEASALKKDERVRDFVTLENLGYADIGSENLFKPYLYVASMSEGFENRVAINLKSGRLPQNSSEILIPAHLSENGRVTLSLGDTLDLSVGERSSDGYALYQSTAFVEDEKLVNTTHKTYTVVGFYERFDTDIEPYTAPGYTAITTGELGKTADVFFRFKSVFGAREKIKDMFETYGTVISNHNLLMVSGSMSSSSSMNMVWGFAAILMGLIMFGSVSLIYNSFSISVSERTKQFGMLKSVGATRPQIMSSVIKEACMLCLVGVPLGLLAGCVGIGITLHLMSSNFSVMFSGMYAGGYAPSVRLALHLSPAALGIAAAIGVVTTLISAYIPAKRAVRISPLEAVRQSGDINIRRRKIKKYKLTRKLFGFEGMIAAKNFARNKKRYRAAIMSMFMSVVLFVSASSFCDYLTNAVDTISNDNGYDIRIFTDLSKEQDPSFLLDIKNKSEAAYCTTDYRDVLLDESIIAPEYSKMFTGRQVFGVDIYFADDESYQSLIKENGLSDNGGAVIVNEYKCYDENGKVTVYPIINEKKIKDSITLSEPKELEGYYCTGADPENIYYYPMEADAENAQELTVPLDGGTVQNTYPVAGFVDEKPFFVDNSGIIAIFPESARPDDSSDYIDYKAYYVTRNYAACEKELTDALDSRGMGYNIYNYAEDQAANRALVTIINVFSYGFIILISLIALANVFNTVTTNIYLRRRELAMMKSVGMTKRGFNKMMNYECIICGIRSLLFGLPVSIGVTFLIYLAANSGFGTGFYVPWYSITVAVMSVFTVVFAAMLYSMNKLKKENIIETLRNENI